MCVVRKKKLYKMKKQIIAFGGGGFSMEPENPLIDDYILVQSDKAKPNICFIGTASGDAESYSDRFYKCFNTKSCNPTHLSLFKGKTADIESFILKQDIVYVGGGNTRNMLVLWKEWNLDKILFNAYEKGTILTGLSAGAICWFEQGLTDSVPGQLNALNCLGFLKGSNCPHFDGEVERQEAYKNKILSGEMKAGYACDDGVGLHYVNEKLEKIVSSRPNAKARFFSVNNNVLDEEIIKPIFLGE